jgi:Kef-type K+ transport system membrane component KefB
MGWPVIAFVATTVHTAGVNWQSVLTIIGSIVTLVAIILTAIARYIAGKVTGAINEFRVSVVDQLTTRLTVVESKIDNINVQTPNHGRR